MEASSGLRQVWRAQLGMAESRPSLGQGERTECWEHVTPGDSAGCGSVGWNPGGPQGPGPPLPVTHLTSIPENPAVMGHFHSIRPELATLESKRRGGPSSRRTSTRVQGTAARPYEPHAQHSRLHTSHAQIREHTLTHDLTLRLSHTTRTDSAGHRPPRPGLGAWRGGGLKQEEEGGLGPPDSLHRPGYPCCGPSGRVLPARQPPPGPAGTCPHIRGSVSVHGLSRDPRASGRGLWLCPVLLPCWLRSPVTDAPTVLYGSAHGGHSTPPCWISVRGGLERTSPVGDGDQGCRALSRPGPLPREEPQGPAVPL